MATPKPWPRQGPAECHPAVTASAPHRSFPQAGKCSCTAAKATSPKPTATRKGDQQGPRGKNGFHQVGLQADLG